jgi:hypothetical protein
MQMQMIGNRIRFYCEELLAPRPTIKFENHSLSAVRNCLFNMFATTLHIGGHSSIRNLWTRHAVVTGTTYHFADDEWQTEVYTKRFIWQLRTEDQVCSLIRLGVYLKKEIHV